MIKNYIALIFIFFSVSAFHAQDCDCKANFEWVKKTFEQNDAGFQYALEVKGEQAYDDHNKRILQKVQNATTLNECMSVLQEWLTFFRSGHIAIIPNEHKTETNTQKPEQNYSDWETYAIETGDFKKQLDKNKISDYEGIWETAPYTIGIKKDGDKYIGFIIESGATTWTKGQVKLTFSKTENETKSVYYMRDHSGVESDNVTMIGKNILQIGNVTLSRIYPVIQDEPKYAQYVKSLNSTEPYIEPLNETTLYIRIPSFDIAYKKSIDSVINANKNSILKTKNLIIDIRNNGGGSDVSYSSIIPFLYTNPIRTVGVEFLSTQLNNQRMLDFIHKPEYGFDDERKKWAKESYDKLQQKLGQFVNLSKNAVSIDKRDTVYAYPQNVGIIINQANGSTSEQFLYEAKQSKKVKLFGVTTFGVLDISNMYFVESPHDERSYFNSDSVYNILTHIKPDVVLIELDSVFFTEDFRFNLKKYPDRLSSNENIGAEKYQSAHKIDLRPFDMTGRNEYYRKIQYFDKQDKMWADVLDLYAKNELSKKDREDVELIQYVQKLYNKMIIGSVKELNADNTMKFLSLREKIIYPKMVSVIENTQNLHQWIDFAKEWESHWYKRNAIMADNIRMFTKEYKNKRMVILVGVEHKPGLLYLLDSDNSTDFVIKEY